MPKPWAKYEIGFLRHAKFLALTSNAICLWLEAKSYCDEHLTDGLFPRVALRTFRFNGSKSVEALMTSCGLKPNGDAYAPLWEPVDIGGVAYIRMHDFLVHNECREAALKRIAQVKARRDADRDRKAAARAAKSGRASALCPQESPHGSPHGHPSEIQPMSASIQKQKQNQNQNQAGKEHPLRDGRSKRPIYQSDRFVVFEWQLDRLSETLGPHVDDFDLHGFFDELSKRSRSQGLVIPSDRDERWAWLQAEVEAEARTRGLPFAEVTAKPEGSKRVAGLVTGGQAFLSRRQPA